MVVRADSLQQGTGSTPISAIPAAIAEDTTLLLGLWASGDNMDNEIAALKNAIDQYGEEFGKLVVGISVGSEDLYRNSEIGVQANAGIGVEPEELASYIKRVRETIAGTSLKDVPLGHVDTWNSWTNGSNTAVVEAVDWLGFDGYPYFENTKQNSIDDGKRLFDEAVQKTKSVANGKEVWITETGWPVSGDKQNLAVASVENAKQFWDEVGCPLFDNVNTWWYILQDAAGSSTPNPSFGIVGNTLSTKPLFDLTCSASSKKTSTSSAGSSKTSASGAGASTAGSESATTGLASTSMASPSASSSGSGLGHGGSLGSSGSFSGGHYAGSSSIVVSSSASPFATVMPTSGSSGSGSGSGSGSSSGSGSGADAVSDSGSGSGSGSGSSGSSDQATTSTSADSADFTGAGSRVSGSIFGAAILVAALAVAL